MAPGLAAQMPDVDPRAAPSELDRTRSSGASWGTVGLATLAAAVLLLLVEGIRAPRPDLVAVATVCLLLGGLAWASRHHITRSLP